MVTGGAATANRIPLLLLPGDIYASRQPDPVLQQIEQYHDLSISTNDASARSPATGTALTEAADECNVKRDANAY
jgi:TPP-dependent trihydroxycyclohexane-1,2-dione (THcHDO) dehydratase